MYDTHVETASSHFHPIRVRSLMRGEVVPHGLYRREVGTFDGIDPLTHHSRSLRDIEIDAYFMPVRHRMGNSPGTRISASTEKLARDLEAVRKRWINGSREATERVLRSAYQSRPTTLLGDKVTYAPPGTPSPLDSKSIRFGPNGL